MPLHWEPTPGDHGTGLDIFLVPPVIGLHPPLDVSFTFIARALSVGGHRTTIVSFPGQHGNEGVFSVARSCFQLREHVRKADRPFLIFGICSGALAALAASVSNVQARGVFCWDLSSNIEYSQEMLTSLSQRYGVMFCRSSALLPVQATQLVQLVNAPIVFAYPKRSFYTRPRLQQGLAKMAAAGRAVCLENTGHFPGVPRGSEKVFAQALSCWAESFSLTSGEISNDHK